MKRINDIGARFMSRVKKDAKTGCWTWQGKTTGGKRYAQFGAKSIANKPILVHRYAYEKFIGPVPDGLVIDRTCENMLCVNPEHMEAITREELGKRVKARKTVFRCGHKITPENTKLRGDWRQCRTCWIRDMGGVEPVENKNKTHCPQGHEYTPENTYYRRGDSGRMCKICMRAQGRARAERDRQRVKKARKQRDKQSRKR